MLKPGVNELAQYFENISSVINQGIVIVDHEGIVLRINPAFTKIFGYQEHEILGKPFYILEYKDEVMQKNISLQPLINFYKTEKSSLEMSLFDKQGCKVSARVRSVFIKDKHGHNAQIIGIIECMPEQKDTGKTGDSLAEKMWEAQQNFENILNNSADAIAMCDIDGNITMVNKSFSDMLDCTQEELIGKHIVELCAYLEGTYPTTAGDEVTIDKEYIAYNSTRPAELYEKESISNWEFYLVRKDKVHVPVEATMTLLKDKDGNRRGSVIIGRDISERKKTEKEIREAKEYLDNAIENSLDAIIITDNNGCLVRANQSFLKLIGGREEEVIGKHMAEFSPLEEGTYESTTGESVQIGKEYFDDVTTFAARLFEEGKIPNHESYKIRNDKKLVPIESNTSLLYNEKKEQIGAIGVVRDITERKKMQDKLLQSEKLKSLGELAGGIAHDFNNLLAAILGRVQLLKTQIKPIVGKQEKRKAVLELMKGLEVIERASLDGAETVRRIHEFAVRRDDDRYFTQVNLNEIIDNALEFTRIRWKNETESKGMRIKIKKELSPLNSTLGSSSELREVFTNLITNAIDAMPEGGEIGVESFMDDTIAVIRIGDTGGGIPKDIKDRIFDPFFTTKDVKSTGLGLSVSYGIINRHRGTITVDSIEGEGTTFTVKFPITEKTDEWKVKDEKVVPIKTKQQKASILVIEDEEAVRDLLRDILIDAGHNVEVSNDGREGIEIFKKKKFDLVFTDLGMPVMSGWEVAEKVKSINGKVPVALITGWNVALDSSEMKNSVVNLVLHKPFKLEQVLNLVQEGLLLRD